jgi:hypothetical protein
MKRPSDISREHPWNSVFENWEHEQIASNIMKILKRTGDTFRELSFGEYKDERVKDGADAGAVDREQGYFERVLKYTVSAEMAARFSPSWK